MSTPRRGALPPWPWESAWQPAPGFEWPASQTAPSIQFLFQRALGTVKRIDGRKSWGPRRPPPPLPPGSAEQPPAPPSDRGGPGNNAAWAPFWNVNAWTQSTQNRGTNREPSLASSRSGHLLFKGNHSSRWARSRRVLPGAVSSADQPQLTCSCRCARRPTPIPPGAEHGEAAAAPAQKLGGAGAPHQNRGRPPRRLRAPTAARPRGRLARLRRRSAAGAVSGSAGLSLPSPVCLQPPTETVDTSSAALGEWTSTNSVAVLAGGPQEEHQPHVIRKGEQKGGAQGGGHAKG